LAASSPVHVAIRGADIRLARFSLMLVYQLRNINALFAIDWRGMARSYRADQH
jgi:hypothetical protein